ncbi:VanW family protein [Clostridium sp. KNHs214]|uniref:VanW family protein n=1 Tax=Clostridium sp. KNHs214 TaxID=1540257 RepID=UPI0005565C84|nr:VanW family protein [Clostridium sp. KNHs214]
MSRSKRSEKNNKPHKSKVLLLVVSFFIIIVVAGALGVRHHIYSVCEKYDNVIYPGVSIENIDVSGKTKEQAITLINEKYGDKVLKKNILIKAPNKEYKISYSQLNAKYNISETVDEAFKYARNMGILQKYKLIKNPKNQKHMLKFKYDGKYIDVLLNEMKKEINKEAKDATIRKVGDLSFDVTESVDGKVLNEDKLKKNINSSINGKVDDKDSIITPEIKTVAAKVQSKSLKSINSRISYFTTKFNTSASNENRNYNIKLSAKAINGRIIMPGESFSFNEVVGERSAARGYKDAPVIVGNKVESGLGGGVCQVSSTLYNAVLRANMRSIQRTPHTLPSSYVPKGLDATVSYGSLDYKFKNTLNYPVYLESYAEGNTLVCSIYSNLSLNQVKYDFVSEVYETIPSSTNYVNDSTLPKGTEVIETTAKNGYRVNVYKVTYKNGQQVSKDLLYKDYYKPVNGVVKRGIK